MESGTKNLETMPPTRASGTKTAVVVSVDEVMALATSVVPLSAASSGSYYRVVHHASYGDGKARQRDDVQRQVVGPGEKEGGEHGRGQRDGRHERGAQRAQEREDHQYRKHGADEALLDQPVHRFFHVGRGVEDDHDLIPPYLIAHVI
jgi:hypothetical protein